MIRDEPDPVADPHGGDESEPTQSEVEGDAAPVEMVSLPGLTALDVDRADDVAANQGAELIVLAGEYEVGKTTLLVSLYEMFRRGPTRGTSFVESRTLMAFEERAWGGRAASGAAEPDTDRSASDVLFMHLRLARDGLKRDFLLSDFWGEFFEQIVEGSPALTQLPILRRADSVLVLVDGKLVADAVLRHDALVRAEQLIGGLTEKDVLRDGVRLLVVLNKIDVMNGGDLEWWRSKHSQLKEIAERHGYSVSFLEVAARRKDPPHESENVDELLEVLLRPRAPRPAISPPMRRHSERSFWSQEP